MDKLTFERIAWKSLLDRYIILCTHRGKQFLVYGRMTNSSRQYQINPLPSKVKWSTPKNTTKHANYSIVFVWKPYDWRQATENSTLQQNDKRTLIEVIPVYCSITAVSTLTNEQFKRTFNEVIPVYCSITAVSTLTKRTIQKNL